MAMPYNTASTDFWITVQTESWKLIELLPKTQAARFVNRYKWITLQLHDILYIMQWKLQEGALNKYAEFVVTHLLYSGTDCTEQRSFSTSWQFLAYTRNPPHLI
jgi:hypothetical protein